MNLEIANRLQKLRKEKGYSQEQLADALGISRQAVSKWERAEASPDTDNLILLARLYGISLDELLSTDENTEDIKKENQAKEEEKIKEEPNNKTNDNNSYDKVNIGSKGIDIEDSDGSKVHIGLDGIRIFDSEEDEEINLGVKGFKVESNKTPKGLKIARDLFSGLAVMGAIIAYIVLGCFWNLWHPAWIIFLGIPLICSIPDVIYKRRLAKFPYPVLVVIVYLLLGFLLNGWHPYWFLFLTIPVYYIIVNPIDKLIRRDKRNIMIDGESISDVNLKDLKGKKFTIEADGKTIIIDTKGENE